MNNSSYEGIKNVIEEGDNVVSQPQFEKQNTDHFKSHEIHNIMDLALAESNDNMINSL